MHRQHGGDRIQPLLANASMKYVMIALGFANGTPCPHAGQYLKSFDHEAYNGQGFGMFTKALARAKRFDSREDVFAFWSKQSERHPLRSDGKPNKPLTALSVNVEPVNE
jgi:hypothetical protein